MLNKVELRSRMGAKATSAKRVFVGRCIWGLARHVVIESVTRVAKPTDCAVIERQRARPWRRYPEWSGRLVGLGRTHSRISHTSAPLIETLQVGEELGRMLRVLGIPRSARCRRRGRGDRRRRAVSRQKDTRGLIHVAGKLTARRTTRAAFGRSTVASAQSRKHHCQVGKTSERDARVTL